MKIPNNVKRVADLFDAGHTYVVGGAVRDFCRGVEPKDYDLLVAGYKVHEVEQRLKTLPGWVDLTGEHFGVFRWRHNGQEIEVALPRNEMSTGPGHQDFDVYLNPNMKIETDLRRRDFTINAMAYRISDGELIDPYGGADDIESGMIRMVSNRAFEEDPLRILRAFVLRARYAFVFEWGTWSSIEVNNYRIPSLAPERIQMELDKIFEAPNPHLAIWSMYEFRTLDYVFPELAEWFEFDQNNQHHTLVLGEHLLQTLENIVELTDDKDLRLAALLHDIGKPESKWIDPKHGTYHYYKKRYTKQEWDNAVSDLNWPEGTIIQVPEAAQWIDMDTFVLGKDHAIHGAYLAICRLEELRYPQDRIKRIGSLIYHHMYPPFYTKKGARRFLNRVGEHADDLLTLRIADSTAKTDKTYWLNKNETIGQHELIYQVRNENEPTDKSMLAVNGHDLIEAGLEGRQIGQALNEMVEVVLDDPERNTKEYLLSLLEDVK